MFKLSPSGTETLLHSFADYPADGARPYAGLILDEAGNLYGTTQDGGTSGEGTVFKLSPSGTETVLHSFAGGPRDGAFPGGVLIRDEAGNLYGTTAAEGTSNGGTVFKLSPTGTETVLHNFALFSPTDGTNPTAGLIRDEAGNFYGTTYRGGASNFGAVFKLSPTGAVTLLQSFAGYPTDGADPEGRLIRDEAGNFYGTTSRGGASNLGTVFKLTLDEDRR